ncbi:MAG: hypothetical protein KAU46_02760 [Candidatus Aminicenantes bacterium]|nr:hypothetical protein [Candidatus Aminicenantes bacterium]
MQSLRNQILARVRGKGRGCVFSSKDFLDLGNRNPVDKTLSRLFAQGIIRRVTTGIYDFPREDEELGGRLSPDIQQVAQAIARKNGVSIQPSGALAANLLGLSTQVPAKIVYLTNGKSRTVKINNRILIFKRVKPREMRPGNEISILVTQALRFLGKGWIEKNIIYHLRQQLSDADRKKLLKDARYMEDWIWEVVQRITSKGEPGEE